MERETPIVGRRGFIVGGVAASTILARLRAQEGTSATQPGAVMSKLAGFVAGTRYDALPPGALENAKTAILDSLGVAVAGGHEESAVINGRLVREEQTKEECTVYGQRFRSSVTQSAFVNGIALHAHDFDHSYVVGGQPTSPIIPAVFALGEALGASGRRVLEAYVTGFDVTSSMVFAVQGAGGRGWHLNGTMGVFGATAACAKLLGLKEPEIVMALATAASTASGMFANFGTMTKPLHVGLAARNGVLAARLAQAGHTANPQTLEARNGFFDCYYPTGKPNFGVFDDLGRVYALDKNGVRFKPYPCGGLTHTSIYASIRLRTEHGLTPDMIEHVDVEVPADTAAPLVYRIPKTGLEGKFSMPYLVARALIDGKIMLETFTDEAVEHPAVRQLAERVEMKVDPGLQAGSDGSRPGTVTIRLKNGQTLTQRERFPKGSPQVPMSPDELREKFHACTRPVIGNVSADRVQAHVGALETMDSIKPLTELLRG